MTGPWPDGYTVTRLETAGSTNDVAKEAAAKGAADGAVYWTPHQTAGRGTHGREWETPPGNLAVSILKRPDLPMRFAAQAALVTAVAVAEAVEQTGVHAGRIRLKWPNDVMIDGKKVSGILLEGQAAGSAVDWLVIGTGINVVHHPANTRHPATDLAEAGLVRSADEMLPAYLAAFDKWWGRWLRYDFQVIQTAWAARTLHKRGDEIRLSQGKETIHARYKGLAPDGALVVVGQDGLEKHVVSGEIFAE
jgi:BirA family biotin operon repressor/biotin-[acetyl-CoA-carboxylase] ligase